MKYATTVRVTEGGRELAAVKCWGLADTVQTFTRYVLDFLEAEIDHCQTYTLRTWTEKRAAFEDNWNGGELVVEIEEAQP